MEPDSAPEKIGHYKSRRFRWLWVCYLLAVLGPVLIVMADETLRGRRTSQQSLRWFEILDLSTVALYPSGTIQRHPQTLWPGMAIGFSPWLPAAVEKEAQSTVRAFQRENCRR